MHPMSRERWGMVKEKLGEGKEIGGGRWTEQVSRCKHKQIFLSS